LPRSKVEKKMSFTYETHAHTSEVSACAASSAAELVRFYKSIGYSGICITDHFLNGNTRVPRDISWEDRVEQFCLGYENALEEGEKIGLKVFFGWEYSYNGSDFLTYGLDKKWLLKHPDVIKWNIKDYFSRVREDGAYVVHAHPFREAGYIPYIRLMPRMVDAVEVVNTSMSEFVNKQADAYAETYSLKKSGGSDIHNVNREIIGGVITETEVNSINELIKLISEEKVRIAINNVKMRNKKVFEDYDGRYF